MTVHQAPNAEHAFHRSIVVGVTPANSGVIVTAAAAFAQRFEAELVCVSVDASRYPVEEDAEGAVIAMPVDSDLADAVTEEFDPRLRATIAHALEPCGVRWSTRALAGGAAEELARVADELDAEMIVVGTRERGIRGSLHEFFNGSVAVQLAHRQHRPVVVIPLSPVIGDGELPWQRSEADA